MDSFYTKTARRSSILASLLLVVGLTTGCEAAVAIGVAHGMDTRLSATKGRTDEVLALQNAKILGHSMNDAELQSATEALLSYRTVERVACWSQSRIKIDPASVCAIVKPVFNPDGIPLQASLATVLKTGRQALAATGVSSIELVPSVRDKKLRLNYSSLLLAERQVVRAFQWQEESQSRLALAFPRD